MNRVHQHDALHFQSETMVLRLLRRIHPAADQSSLYRSAPKVAASARQAVNFQESAAKADVCIQPLLSYYALLHWMKASLFMQDLSYPPSSSVLQHGLSLRRSKRSAYRWPLEAVHVHKEGVLQSFCALFHAEASLPERFIVGDALGSLPGTCGTIAEVYPQFQHVYEMRTNGDRHAWVSRRIASNIGLTVAEWLSCYSAAYQGWGARQVDDAARNGDPEGWLRIPYDRVHPWISEKSGMTYTCDSPPQPPWLYHFAILYTLSSLCRYNPVEWSDVMTWNNELDALLVRAYLDAHPIDQVCASVLTTVQIPE